MAGNRLLILDDDLRVLTLLSEIGRQRGYEITATSTVAQFLDAYERIAPSLLILDLQYRDGDGIALMSRLKELRCTQPVILISGVDARVLETAKRIGETNSLRIVGALTKPVHLQTIGPLLDQHRQPDLEEWAVEIRTGLEEGQFSLAYQPKVAVPTGRVLGFEALARWHHPQRGPIGPDRFIVLAEETGQIGPLTELVLGRAIMDCGSWGRAGFDLSVAVNIAAPILTGPRILDTLLRLLDQHGLSTSKVIFEVTESTAMSHPAAAMELLGRLRLHGVRLSLDDFGTGFSNLALLHEMPFNELKIDRRFIADADTNVNSQVIVRALAGLAKNFGMTTVAEGVETDAVWDWLHTLGIDQVQGYSIARPMPAHAVLPWLANYENAASPGVTFNIA